MALHADYAVVVSFSRQALQDLLHAVWVAGAIPSRFEGSAGTLPGVGPVQYRVSLGEPQVVFEPMVYRPTLRLDARGTLTIGSGTNVLTPEVVILADLRAPIVPVDAPGPRSKSPGRWQRVSLRLAGEVRIGFDLRAADFSRFEMLIGGFDASVFPGFSGAVDQIRTVVQAALRAIPPERFLFTPPLFDQLRALGYMLSRPAVKLSPDAVTLGFDVIRRGPKGEVVFSTKGDPAALQDLHSAVAPRGFRKTFVQWLSAGTDEYGKPLGETGYTGSTRPPPGPHATQAAIAVNAMLLHDLYDIAGRFSVLEAFERSKAEAAQGRIRGLRAQPRSSTWVGQGHDGADRRFDVGSSERVVIHHAALGLEDGALSLRANITYLGDVSISTLVRITLRVVRLSVSGSTPFVVRHASKEGLRIEIASVQVDEPTAVGVLQALGFVVGVALAPVTAGASLAIAAMAVLVVDATVDALLGNAERQAHGGLSKAAATGFGLPLDWTSIQLVPNAPVVLDLRPNDAAISTEGVFTWFELRPRLGTARLRAEDVSVQDIWPSTRLEPIVLLLEGAESLVHPEDSAVRIEWTLTVPGSSIPPRVTESTLCPARGPDHAAVRFSIDHQSAALRPFDHFVVSCRVYRPGETGTKELFQGKTAIRITDRLLREKPYVRWAHAAFFEGFTRRVGDPFRASKGTVRAERTSRIHLTDPALRCKMADRYSKHLLPTSLDYLAALPFPSSELVKHRSSVCEYCFFGGPTHPDPKPGV